MIDFSYSQINLISINSKYENKIGNKNNQISSHFKYINNNTQNKKIAKNEEDSSNENYITTADELLKEREVSLYEDFFKGWKLDIPNIYDILKYNNNEEEIFLIDKKAHFEIILLKMNCIIKAKI